MFDACIYSKMALICNSPPCFYIWDGEGIHGVGKVLFNALNDLINDTAMQAHPIQGRGVTEHLRDIWCQVRRRLLPQSRSMNTSESQWSRLLPKRL
ncbi:hypothetical protein AAC387_Pa12g1858 [Persea americana]